MIHSADLLTRQLLPAKRPATIARCVAHSFHDRVQTLTSQYALLARLPKAGEPAFVAAGDLLDRFLSYCAEKGLSLYPAQEEAILQVFDGNNVILNTPTGSGKSLVALAMHFYSLGQGRRSFYTCPIKALVNEKFLALCHDFGPDNVGMITGDATVNARAPIICCTAEILANYALRDGTGAQVDDVVMDEFHYYSDRERGVAWQVPLLILKRSRFMLMSATLGDISSFERGLTQLTGKPTVVVKTAERPVPLSFQYQETPLHESVQSLVNNNLAPIYLVSFTQRECAETAQSLTSFDLCTKEEKKALNEAMSRVGLRYNSPFGKELQKLARHGIGLHHAGLLPKYRYLIERLAQQGLLKVICGTDTLGVGVNVPIRTVLFTKLCKYDGQKSALLSVRDFKQIAGRAGRKGFDTKGLVVVQAPEHVIENQRLEAKAGGDSKKLRKIVRKKPPEKGFVNWTKETFDKLQSAEPEALQSRFQVSHGMLLNVLSRPGDGCTAMRELLRACHESDAIKERLRRTSFQMFRALVERNIIEFTEPDYNKSRSTRKGLRVNVDLQNDFSLHHALALYLLDTVKMVDPYSETYALDIVTLAESIIENPEVILRKQRDKQRFIRLMELKLEGVEYDERMAELEKVEYPKPNAEFIYETFNEFQARHPWVAADNIRPKSIAREMYEGFMSFSEYIREYELQRSEGLLLRYLAEIYRVLAQTLPPTCKNEEMESIIDYLGAIVRQVDSTLIDEWEKLKDPTWQSQGPREDELRETYDVTKNMREFTVAVRNEVFQYVKALVSGRVEWVIENLREHCEAQPMSLEQLKDAYATYRLDHQGPSSGRDARSSQYFTSAAVGKDLLKVQQTLLDTEGSNDWSLDFEVDLGASRTAGRPVLRLIGLGAIG